MKSTEEVNLESILPSNGPSINEVKKYLNKYKNEYIVVKIGGSVLNDKNLAYISRYATGGDYHKLLRKRLKKLTKKCILKRKNNIRKDNLYHS